MKTPVKFITFVSVLVAAGALAAGCGSSSSSSSSTASTAAGTTSTAAGTPSTATGTPAAAPVAIAADASALAFDKTAITVPAGDATFNFNNPASIPHNFSIKGADGTEVGATATVTGQAAPPLTVTLKAGTYTFYCSVPGHEAGGMKGTLTVQ